jgi:hypothetical protein
VHLEASTKPHIHQNFEIFWTNIASTMVYPNFKNGPKIRLRPLGVKSKLEILSFMCKFFGGLQFTSFLEHKLVLFNQKILGEVFPLCQKFVIFLRKKLIIYEEFVIFLSKKLLLLLFFNIMLF